MDIHFNYKSVQFPIHISHRKRDTPDPMPEYHAHDDHYEIYFLLSGDRRYFIKDRTYHIEAGNLVFIQKGDLHKTFPVKDYAHERILINYTDAFIHAKDDEEKQMLHTVFTNAPVIRLNVYERQVVENMLFSIIKEIKEQPTGFETYIQSLLKQFLLYSLRNFNRQDQNETEYQGSLYHTATDMVHYINEHYTDCNLMLSTISENLHMSTSYASRIFKHATGFTFSEYVNTVRVQHAQQLLRETAMKVIDISEQVGFNSIVHFGRVFKRITGYSPTVYRKNHRQS